MTYRNIGFVLILVAMLLCLVMLGWPSVKLLAVTVFIGLLGLTTVIGTFVEAED